jgi:hypothetical protein
MTRSTHPRREEDRRAAPLAKASTVHARGARPSFFFKLTGSEIEAIAEVAAVDFLDPTNVASWRIVGRSTGRRIL